MTRRFPGQRALRIAVRTAHIAAAVVLLGAVTWGHDPGASLLAVLLTGFLLVADDLYRYGPDWFRWVQSWVILGKLLVVALAATEPWALWTALVLGSVISHAPGTVRQRPLWGRPGPCAVKGSRSAAPGLRGR